MVIDNYNFENPYWNLINTLTWMYTSSNNLIPNEEALRKVLAESQRRFVPSDLAVIITLPDEDKYDALERNALSSELTERLKQQLGDLNWFDSLEKELIDALRSNEIKCTGINSNSGNREDITAMEWIDLKFYYGIPTFQAGPEYYGSGTRWYGLKLPAESIQERWPINSKDDQSEPTTNDRKPSGVSMKDDMQRDKRTLAKKWKEEGRTFIQMELSKELATNEKYNHIKYTTIEKLTRKV